MNSMSVSASIFSKPMPKEDSDYTAVRYNIDPYSRDRVQSILRSVANEFGRGTGRWYWRYDDSVADLSNTWVLLFFFKDPYDASVFCLKYLE